MKSLTKKALVQVSLVLMLIAILSLHFLHTDIKYHDQFVSSLLCINIFYFVFKIIMEEMVHRRLKDYRRKYTFRKVTSILFLLLTAIILLGIWIKDPQAILLAYGIIAAGIAIALQDLFKDFTGGIMIIMNNLYKVGDRIEINGTHGDVIDIGILYTTMLETRDWVRGDQATGRIISMPNSTIMSNKVMNYTRDHNFLWEEITIPVTFDSNWEVMINPLLKELKAYCQEMTKAALKDIEIIGEKFYLPKRDVEPAVYVSFDNNFINIRVRFVTEAKKRRFHADNVFRMILREAAKHRDVKISQTQLETWKIGEHP